MPTNKQRREAARRHLERQLQRRIETNVKRKRRNLIITVVSSVVVVLVIVLAMVAYIHEDKKKSAAASPSTTASDTASASPSASASAAPQPMTAGPCGYTQTTTPATKDVGFPPDPSPTPTVNRVVSMTTNKGAMVLTLDAGVAPCTVQSISYLVGKGYYDNTSCFRLVTSGIFVLQCGDPANAGTGGPGYQSKDENLDKADYSVVGTVAMANAGPGTDGSQFFIIYKDTSAGLGKDYTEIGKITTGMDIVQAIAAAGEDDANGAGDGKPKSTLTFTKMTVAPPVTGSGTMVTPAPTASAATVPTATAPTSSPAASSTGSKSP